MGQIEKSLSHCISLIFNKLGMKKRLGTKKTEKTFLKKERKLLYVYVYLYLSIYIYILYKFIYINIV